MVWYSSGLGAEVSSQASSVIEAGSCAKIWSASQRVGLGVGRGLDGRGVGVGRAGGEDAGPGLPVGLGAGPARTRPAGGPAADARLADSGEPFGSPGAVECGPGPWRGVASVRPGLGACGGAGGQAGAARVWLRGLGMAGSPPRSGGRSRRPGRPSDRPSVRRHSGTSGASPSDRAGWPIEGSVASRIRVCSSKSFFGLVLPSVVLYTRRMKLSIWAKQNGVPYKTAWKAQR